MQNCDLILTEYDYEKWREEKRGEKIRNFERNDVVKNMKDKTKNQNPLERFFESK